MEIQIVGIGCALLSGIWVAHLDMGILLLAIMLFVVIIAARHLLPKMSQASHEPLAKDGKR